MPTRNNDISYPTTRNNDISLPHSQARVKEGIHGVPVFEPLWSL